MAFGLLYELTNKYFFSDRYSTSNNFFCICICAFPFLFDYISCFDFNDNTHSNEENTAGLA